MIYRVSITRDELVDAIDICRTFETSLNFWDENGDGWAVLRASHYQRWRGSSTDAAVAFSSWLVKSSSPDIKEALPKENLLPKGIFYAIYWADDQYVDFIDFLLGLRPTGTPHDNAGVDYHDPDILFHHINYHNWKIVNLLLAWGFNPHYVYRIFYLSPVAESPLSAAMYSSWTFWGFRNLLHSRGLDVQDFARKELEEGRPLLETGWQMETLIALLELDFEPYIASHDGWRECSCDSCNRNMGLDHVFPQYIVQPYWQSFLESVKSGVSPHDLCSITQDDQPSNDQRNPTVINDSTTDTAGESALSALSEDQAAHPNQESPTKRVDISSTVFDKKDIWCVWCWYHFKETGHPRSPASETESSDEDDASEDDFSPYLIHT